MFGGDFFIYYGYFNFRGCVTPPFGVVSQGCWVGYRGVYHLSSIVYYLLGGGTLAWMGTLIPRYFRPLYGWELIDGSDVGETAYLTDATTRTYVYVGRVVFYAFFSDVGETTYLTDATTGTDIEGAVDRWGRLRDFCCVLFWRRFARGSETGIAIWGVLRLVIAFFQLLSLFTT